MSDDHAYQAISAYGHCLNETPNIDRIAKEGALFMKGFVTNSISLDKMQIKRYVASRKNR
jgi:arylsulfatase A-like enzyme